jgi:tetratricopeptide (TPR) repeat protein
VLRFRSDLAFGREALAALLRESGRPVEALDEYNKARGLREALAKGDSRDPQNRADLASTIASIGRLELESGRFSEALAEIEKARAIDEELVKANPTIPSCREGLAFVLILRADALLALNRIDEARDGYNRAIAILDPMVVTVPTVPGYRALLAQVLRGLTLVRSQAGDLAGAVLDARRALAMFDGLPHRSPDDWYGSACAHAALATLAGREGSGISAEEAEHESDRAMDRLRKAVAMGYRDAQAMKREVALDPLRSRADFQALMAERPTPADPVAR